MYREYLEAKLPKQIVRVTFNKVDGTERIMFCTTCPDLIPEGNLPTGEQTYEEHKTVQRVWDIDKKAWRSFRLDSIIECTTDGATKAMF